MLQSCLLRHEAPTSCLMWRIQTSFRDQNPMCAILSVARKNTIRQNPPGSIQLVLTSGRTKHPPNCGYRFVSPLPRFSQSGICRFPVPETLCFSGKPYCFYRISSMNPLFPPTRKLGAKGDTKWWPSIWCMFDSL